MACRARNSPGAYPVWPHDHDELTVARELHDAVVSVGVMAVRDEDVAVGSATTTSDGELKLSRPLPAMPGVPRRSSTSPVGPNL